MESPILEKLREAEMENMVFLEYFVVPLHFEDVQANAAPDLSAQIPNDSDFLIREVHRTVFDGGSYIENPNLLIDIVDSGSGRLFNTNTRPHIVTVTGTGQHPYYLPEPRIVAGGNALTVIIIERSGGIIDDVHISFIGTKIFYRGGQNMGSVLGPGTPR